jgi:hypothetical protein
VSCALGRAVVLCNALIKRSVPTERFRHSPVDANSRFESLVSECKLKCALNREVDVRSFPAPLHIRRNQLVEGRVGRAHIIRNIDSTVAKLDFIRLFRWGRWRVHRRSAQTIGVSSRFAAVAIEGTKLDEAFFVEIGILC